MRNILSNLKNFEQRKIDYLLLISLGFILFFPVLLGKFSIAGTDLLFNHYPNLIWGQQLFKQYGSLPLWNGDIFLGTDFTKSMHAHYLNPLLWFVLFCQTSQVLYFLTLFYLTLNIIMGVCVYKIANLYGLNRYFCLVVSVTTQASMFFWFAMTTMIGVYISSFALICMYLILSFNKRNNYINYVFLTLCLFFIVSTPHPAYILGVMLPIVILIVYLEFPKCFLRPWSGITGIFTGAMITAIMLSIYRLLPVFKAIIYQGVALAGLRWMVTSASNSYLLMTMINPLSWGGNLGQSMSISQLLGYGGMHIQAHTALYFGVFSLFILFTLFKRSNQNLINLLIIIFFITISGFINFLEIFSDFVVLIFYPIMHTELFRINSFFVFLAIMIVGLKKIQNYDQSDIKALLKNFSFFSIILVLTGVVFYAKILGNYFQHENIANHSFYPHLFRAFICILLLLMFNFKRVSSQYFSTLAFQKLIVVIAITGSMLLVFFTKKYDLLSSSNIIFLKNYFALLFGCFGILGFLKKKNEYFLWLGLFATISLLYIKVSINRPELNFQFFLISATGWISFIVITLTLLNILGSWACERISKSQMNSALLVLVSLDLIVSYVNYSYCNLSGYTPFYRGMDMAYPGVETLQSPVEIKESFKYNLNEEKNKFNLFKNDEFLYTNHANLPNWSLGGKTIRLCNDDKSKSKIIKVCYDSDDQGGNFFQDVYLDKNINQISSGAWVKSPVGTDVGMFITSPPNNSGTTRIIQKGDGKWHWISQSFKDKVNLEMVRVHFNIIGKGEIFIFAPRLVEGSLVLPKKTPKKNYTPYIQPQPEILDAQNYRFSHVTIFNKNAGNELVSNYAMLYHTPTYAGVDSDQSSDYVDFLAHFKPLESSWWARFGLLGVVDDSRFLDLVGVKYDVDENGKKIVRLNAIPRFAAYASYRTETDKEKAFDILKDPNFEYDKQLLVNEKIIFPYKKQLIKYHSLNYSNVSNDEISLKINSETPRLILFNDHFSPDWDAYFNGEKLGLFKVNNLFMGVVLPKGTGTLTFSFKPKLFWFCVKISLCTLFLFVMSLFGYILFLLQRKLKMRHKLSLDSMI